ncbi:hypothetical protein [Streptomyces sp. CA2R106]|uniref:hypothetical protein n=1 Tax=Streptomyces sp. CA2R106 TaxID=3120153 RepID=UPI0030090C8C
MAGAGGRAVHASGEDVYEAGQEAAVPGREGGWDRWWGMALVAVLLPAVLAAAVPRGVPRRH